MIHRLMDEFRHELVTANGIVDVDGFVRQHAASIGGGKGSIEVTYQAWAAVVWYRGLEKLGANLSEMDIEDIFPPDT